MSFTIHDGGGDEIVAWVVYTVHTVKNSVAPLMKSTKEAIEVDGGSGNDNEVLALLDTPTLHKPGHNLTSDWWKFFIVYNLVDYPDK